MFACDYRRLAKEKVKDYSSQLAIIYLIYLLIFSGLGALSIIVVGSIAALIVSGPFVLSFVIITNKVYNKQKV